MNTVKVWALCATLLAGAATCLAKPNIVFIMADDLGWADVGYQGTEFYETPNIDALRESGMNFSMGYPGAANCLPSRACIISGMYSARTKMYQPGLVAKGPPELMRLSVPNEKNRKGDGKIRSVGGLDKSVMTLPMVLKQAGYKTLHLGKWHLNRMDGLGFDRNDLDGRGAGLKMDHKLYGDKDVAEWLTDAAVDYIAESKGDPFFLYLCHWDVHVPINARAEVVTKYRKKKKSKEWSQDWDPVYAAMIEAVDVSVGRVRKALEEKGIAENTLLIFTSDNGGHAGATWNAPLKGSKGGFYEGGIRVPLIMSQPGTIEPGSVCDTAVTGVDYLPTFAELAGAPLPSEQPVDGVSILPLMKGKSIPDRFIFWHYPLYLSGSVQVKPVYGTDKLFWRSVPCSIVRKGDWKLIEFFETGSHELYDLKEDVGEENDLAASHPEKLSEMKKVLKKWQSETGADIPSTLNPDFDPNFKPAWEKKR